MNYEYMVRSISWVNFDICREWIPTIIFIHIVTLLLRPSTNQEILFLIIELSLSEITPWCLCITHPLALSIYTRNDRLTIIGEPLLPYYWTLLGLILINNNRLPFNCSCSITWLCNEVTRCSTNSTELPFNLSPICTNGSFCIDRICTPTPTHLDRYSNRFRSLYQSNSFVMTIHLGRNTSLNEILMPIWCST